MNKAADDYRKVIRKSERAQADHYLYVDHIESCP